MLVHVEMNIAQINKCKSIVFFHVSYCISMQVSEITVRYKK